MDRVEYTVTAISGDYAVLKTADGIENRMALMLLPEDIDEGDIVIYENFEYTIKR